MSSISPTPAGNALTPVRVWVASPAGCRILASAAEAARLTGGSSFAWIDLEETGDAGLRQISETLDLGAEALEMVRRADQRPRFMPLTDATYAAVPVTNPSAAPAGHPAYVCLALTGRLLLTRHSTPCPVLAETRDQYSSLPDNAKTDGPAMLFTVLDRLLQDKEPLLLSLGERLPVIGYLAARDRMAGPLESLRGWLEQNNATVMAVVLLVIGVVLLGEGIGGLSS